MARYRKISVRIHGDAKFRRLSSPPPCGKYLWMVLLTHKRQASVPGLIDVGEATLAEELGWPIGPDRLPDSLSDSLSGRPPESFREAFAEVSREGLAKADWEARLVWLPNALKYNFPESPNVIRGWKTYWDELPECPLKNEAHDEISAVLASKPAFLEAFVTSCHKGKYSQNKPFPNPSEEPSLKSSTKPWANQEQEQEQEQEIPPKSPGAPKPLQAMAESFLRDRTDCAVRYGLPGQWRALTPLFEAFRETWQRDERPTRGPADPRHAILAERLAEGFSVEELVQAVQGAKSSEHIAGAREYQTLRTILRDAAQVDKFRDLLTACEAKANDNNQRSWVHWEEADEWVEA